MIKTYFVFLLLIMCKLLFPQANIEDIDKRLMQLNGNRKLEFLLNETKEVAKSNTLKANFYANEALKLARELKLDETVPECYLLLSDV